MNIAPGHTPLLARFGCRLGAAAEFAHQIEKFVHADARRDIFQRAETHDSLAIDHERRRESDAAIFAAVEQPVRFHHFASGVA